MMFYSDEFASAHAEQHRRQLLDEAHCHRLVRQMQTARSNRSGRMLAAAGALLVRWGVYLQQRSQPPAAYLAESRPT
jgi:type II secretory pathway component PulM